MGKVTCKIVGTQLICRVKAAFYKVIRPHIEYIKVFLCIGRVLFCRAYGCDTKQHVAAFLNRHLIRLFILLQRHAAFIDAALEKALCKSVADTVDLHVCKRVLSDVVRCKFIFPHSQAAHFEYGV